MGLTTLCLMTPAAGAVFVGLSGRATRAKAAALVFSLVTFLESLALWVCFDGSIGDCQMVDSMSWIPRLGASFVLGVDGISLFPVLLSAFVVPLTILAGGEPIPNKARAYFVNLLLLESLILGFFLAVDLFLLYVFWTAMLVPLTLLIAIWGTERRSHAAIRFFAYSMAGNMLVLAVILICHHINLVQSGSPSFDGRLWANLVIDPGTQDWLFCLAFGGFAVQMALFPFHLWHPDAVAGAPLGGGVLLAAVLLKVAAAGVIRVPVALFPQAARSHETAVVTVSVIGILLGASWSCLERDLRRRVAFLNLTHLGLITLGIFSFRPEGVEGALYLMLSHGLYAAAYLIMIDMLHRRWGTYQVGELGGLLRSMPLFAVLFLLVAMAWVGIPGLGGFVGTAWILGSWLERAPGLAALAGLGVLVAAVSVLTMVKETMLGPMVRRGHRGRLDLGKRELAAVIPLILVLVWMGLAPQRFTGFLAGSVEAIVSRAGGRVLPE